MVVEAGKNYESAVETKATKRVNRNLDGIYLRIKRDDKWQPICLSDMTMEELETNLPTDRPEWLKGAVILLAQTLRTVGDKFDIMGE